MRRAKLNDLHSSALIDCKSITKMPKSKSIAEAPESVRNTIKAHEDSWIQTTDMSVARIIRRCV